MLITSSHDFKTSENSNRGLSSEVALVRLDILQLDQLSYLDRNENNQFIPSEVWTV